VITDFFRRSRDSGARLAAKASPITQTFSQKDVVRQWEELKARPEYIYDTLIIGGGAAGAGALRDWALRGGTSAVLIDKGDFAGATSSKSGKAIHPGLWYLRMAWHHLLLAFKVRHESDPRKNLSFFQ